MDTEFSFIDEKALESALYKKAIGYTADEVTEEYVKEDDGTFTLSKKKVTKKQASPNIPAARVLLEHYISKNKSEIENMTDEELLLEKEKLLALLTKTKDTGEEE